MADIIWNPWHGCEKFSEGCQNCYVYRRDESIGKDASAVYKTKQFDLPLRRDRAGLYKIKAGTHVFACMTSDFFLPAADDWRQDAWDCIRRRPDLHFSIITKRVARCVDCLPSDWGGGWPQVTLICTIENQRQCDIRLPVFAALPAVHKEIICEPLLTDIHFPQPLLDGVEKITAGGESGPDARVCDYNWVLHLRRQCEKAGVAFSFKQTGARFLKDGKCYAIPREKQHIQAKKAGIDLF